MGPSHPMWHNQTFEHMIVRLSVHLASRESIIMDQTARIHVSPGQLFDQRLMNHMDNTRIFRIFWV